jgi:hypothetical protein
MFAPKQQPPEKDQGHPIDMSMVGPFRERTHLWVVMIQINAVQVEPYKTRRLNSHGAFKCNSVSRTPLLVSG